MAQQIAGLYRRLRGLFGSWTLKGGEKHQPKREFRRFPESLGELDESYRNLMRELSKR